MCHFRNSVQECLLSLLILSWETSPGTVSGREGSLSGAGGGGAGGGAGGAGNSPSPTPTPS